MNSPNEYLLNIDPNNQEIIAVQEQAVDPNDVYDLGDAENLDQNGERVRQLAAKI